MAKRYPEGFRSFEEWDTYCNCIARCKPGDMVLFYFNEVGYAPTNRITANTRAATVVGRYGHSKYDTVLLLGSDDETIGFWRMKSEMKNPRQHFEYREKAIWDETLIYNYLYGYWCYSYDMRIAKIELKRNETLPSPG